MSRRTDLPSVEDVQIAVKQLGEATGKPPTVLALARHLGLANTTFRRNFPHIATELHQQSQNPSPEEPTGISRFDQLKRQNDQLRRDNHELTEHLELALANIQRLTLENHQLRQHLEATTKSPGSTPTTDPNHRETSLTEPPCRPRQGASSTPITSLSRTVGFVRVL